MAESTSEFSSKFSQRLAERLRRPSTCKTVCGPASYKRHQEVVKTLAITADAHCSALVDKAPVVQSVTALMEGRDSERVIPDLQFNAALWSLATDVTVLFGDGDGYLPEGSALDSAAAKEGCGGSSVLAKLKSKTTTNANTRCNIKCGHYDESMAAVGVQFSPFVMESHGWLHPSSTHVLQALATNAKEAFGVAAGDALGYLKRRVAVALQRGNCLSECYARERSRNSYGGAAAAGLVHAVPSVVGGARARGGRGGGVVGAGAVARV